MRLFIVGQKWLAAELLAACLDRGETVAGVVAPSADDRFFQAALAAGVPAATHGRSLSASAVPDGVDLILAASAHCFLPAEARERARLGALGYHPSLLPRHRGRDAIRWAIHMREAVTGGTVYWMDDGADTGPVALQDWCHIRPDDTPASIWRRELGPMGLRLFVRSIDLVRRGELPALAQCDVVATWEPGIAGKPLSGL